MPITARLTDLDETVLRVRDSNSRLYIGEAVAAYRAGAYRSAIIATWIAVVTDIIAKIKELSNQADANAVAFVQKLNDAIVGHNTAALQKIEQEILAKAECEFEFLSERESVDLARLKADRNLCAHPAFVGEDSLYQPSADLVRTHIVHAVEHLLAHQPVQGKSALERIKQDVRRSTFPTNAADAKRYLTEKYLKRAKTVLLRNLVIVIVKDYLRGTDPDLAGKDVELLSSLTAIAEFNLQIYEQTMAAFLAAEVAGLDEEQLMKIFRLIAADQRCWAWIGEAERIRAQTVLHRMSNKQLYEQNAFAAIGVPELHDFLSDLLIETDATRKQLNSREKAQIIADNPSSEFASLAVELYQTAGSYESAGVIGANAVLPLSGFFTSEQIKLLLEAARTNEQVKVSRYSPEILAKLFSQTFDRMPETKPHWLEFIRHVRQVFGEAEFYSYPRLFELMQAKNLFDA